MDKLDQEKALAENENLVYMVINRAFPSLVGDEDVAQEGKIGLLKAIRVYDESKGAFSTLAVKCIQNSILHYVRKPKSVQAESLDARVGDQGDGIKLADVLEDPSGSIDETRILVMEFLDSLNVRDRKMVWAVLESGTKGEAAEKLGISRALLYKKLSALHEVYKKWMN